MTAERTAIDGEGAMMGTADDGGAEGGIFGVGVPPEDAALVLLAAPWEATTSYGRGTARGPEAILQASVQVDLFDAELGSPHQHGLAMLPAAAGFQARAAEADQAALRVIAAHHAGAPVPVADLSRANALCEAMSRQLQQDVAAWLDRGKAVGVVGGDHSVAFGSIAAHAQRYPGMGVLQFDAHADLRVAYQGFTGSHASVMQRVADEIPDVARLVSVGVRDFCEQEQAAIDASEGRVVAFFDHQIRRHLQAGHPFGALCDEIARALPAQVYVSFDIDGLEPSLCPHTGTPVPGGLSFHQALGVLDGLLRNGREVVGFDLCEVAPGDDEWDANVGARVLFKLIGYLFRSRAGAVPASRFIAMG